jgi:hypothetical protein
MAANKEPIFTRVPDVSTNNGTGMAQPITAAANDPTGVDADFALTHTAGDEGSFLERIRFKSHGTNVASKALVIVNNGSTPGTLTNNVFFGEVSLPATTANAAAALIEIDYPTNLPLPPGFRVYVGLGTAVAAGWTAMGIGGQY